jgi:hypothetical protein
MTSESNSWAALPTETEIYILPNGEIIVADLPAELADQFDHIQVHDSNEPTVITHVANQQHPTEST